MDNENFKYVIAILVIVIIAMILIKVNPFTLNYNSPQPETNTAFLENLETEEIQETEENSEEKDKDESFYQFCEYRKSTFDNLYKNYYREDMSDEEKNSYTKYCQYGLDGVAGDIATIPLVECNYRRYENKDVKIEQYDYPIHFKLGIAHKNANFSRHQPIEDVLKNQIGVVTNTGEKIKKTDNFTLYGMLIINGNDESEELWNQSARAKTINIILDDDKEYKYVLEDTVRAQFLDINYTNESISKPIDAKIEVLDTYGDENSKIYISDILFGVGQSFSSDR